MIAIATISSTLRLNDQMSGGFSTIGAAMDKTVERADKVALAIDKTQNAMDIAAKNVGVYESKLESIIGAMDKNEAAITRLSKKQQEAFSENRQKEIEKLITKQDRLNESYQKTEVSLAKANNAYSEQSQKLESLNGQLNKMNNELGSVPEGTARAGDGFTVMRALAVRVIEEIIRRVKDMTVSFIEYGDQMMQMSSRFGMLATDSKSVADIQQEIYYAAQRSRGAYEDMADSVYKLSTQASSAFRSTEEATAFVELLNKQFVIAGTSASGVESVMYNLTQALSSGVLRGQDLNSVMANAQPIVQHIADYLGEDVSKIREMASEGKLSADVIKNAMFMAADDINDKFGQMPSTTQQTTNLISNQFRYAFSEIGIAFSQFVSGAIEQAATWVVENIDYIINAIIILGTIAAAVAIGMAVAWMVANWPLTLTVAAIMLIIAILTELGVTTEQILTFIGASIGAAVSVAWNLFLGLLDLVLGVINFMVNGWVSFANFFANVLNSPVSSIIHLLADMADRAIGIVESIAKALDNVFGSNLAEAVSGFRSKVSEMAVDLVATYAPDEDYQKVFDEINLSTESFGLERMGYLDSINAGADIGAGIGKGIEDAVGKLKGIGDMSSMAPDISSMASGLGDLISGSGSGSALKTTGDVNISGEDIKMLLDLATMDYKVTYQTLTPQLSLNIDTVRENVDVDYVIQEISTVLTEAAESRVVTA